MLFVTGLGVFGFVIISVSYWNWYGFPLTSPLAEAIDKHRRLVSRGPRAGGHRPAQEGPGARLTSIVVIDRQQSEVQADVRRERRHHPVDPVSMRRVVPRPDVVAVCPEHHARRNLLRRVVEHDFDRPRTGHDVPGPVDHRLELPHADPAGR